MLDRPPILEVWTERALPRFDVDSEESESLSSVSGVRADPRSVEPSVSRWRPRGYQVCPDAHVDGVAK